MSSKGWGRAVWEFVTNPVTRWHDKALREGACVAPKQRFGRLLGGAPMVQPPVKPIADRRDHHGKPGLKLGVDP